MYFEVLPALEYAVNLFHTKVLITQNVGDKDKVEARLLPPYSLSKLSKDLRNIHLSLMPCSLLRTPPKGCQWQKCLQPSVWSFSSCVLNSQSTISLSNIYPLCWLTSLVISPLHPLPKYYPHNFFCTNSPSSILVTCPNHLSVNLHPLSHHTVHSLCCYTHTKSLMHLFITFQDPSWYSTCTSWEMRNTFVYPMIESKWWE